MLAFGQALYHLLCHPLYRLFHRSLTCSIHLSHAPPVLLFIIIILFMEASLRGALHIGGMVANINSGTEIARFPKDGFVVKIHMQQALPQPEIEAKPIQP